MWLTVSIQVHFKYFIWFQFSFQLCAMENTFSRNFNFLDFGTLERNQNSRISRRRDKIGIWNKNDETGTRIGIIVEIIGEKVRKETVYKLEITCFRKWVAGGHLRSLKINKVYFFTALLLAYLLRKPEFSRQRFFELLYTTYVT